jgi:hypothetical protein
MALADARVSSEARFAPKPDLPQLLALPEANIRAKPARPDMNPNWELTHQGTNPLVPAYL